MYFLKETSETKSKLYHIDGRDDNNSVRNVIQISRPQERFKRNSS
jgi:hypothetical protein